MEGFDLISTGVWSIIPPILALGLALITKEVYSSLAIGVFVGMVIYQFSLNGVGVEPLVDSFTMVPQMMAEQIAGNGALLLFLALLGALVVVIAAAADRARTPSGCLRTSRTRRWRRFSPRCWASSSSWTTTSTASLWAPSCAR